MTCGFKEIMISSGIFILDEVQNFLPNFQEVFKNSPKI